MLFSGKTTPNTNNLFMYYNIHCHKSNKNDNTFSIINLDIDRDISPEEDFYYSAGIHPWFIKDDSKPQLEKVIKYSKYKNILAIGEIGLDKRCSTPYDYQLAVFREQIDIANSAQKPIILHCVRSYQEILDLKKISTVDWIIHGFNGSKELALQLINKGIYLSFGKTLLNSGTKTCKAFSSLPDEYIFLETDTDDIKIKDVYREAAKLKGMKLDNLATQISCNFKKVFKNIPSSETLFRFR